jgi:GTP cyclohydrolase II
MNEIRARINLKVGLHSDIDAEIATFSMFDENHEHIALIFQQADKNQQAPLVRMHSECLTGDVFHSSRCDCGEQLDETINLMKDKGGIILYLRQEGRGIGLLNKIKAYNLQDQGADTVEANEQLGFGADLRQYDMCQPMLEHLNVKTIRLMTNNPRKVKALSEAGVHILERVAIEVGRNPHNDGYLNTKASKLGHYLKSTAHTDVSHQDDNA